MMLLIRSCAIVSLLLLATGCGGKSSSTVGGTVTVDDKPLTKGDVTFHPVGDGPLAYGRIDANGKYTLSTGTSAGLNAGEYIATVVATGEPPDDKTPPPVLTPTKYGTKETSELKKTVKPGSNDIPLELKTQ